MDEVRKAQRERERRWYRRKRIGARLVPVPVTEAQRAGLLKLGLIGPGDDVHAMGWAIGRLLDAAEPLAALGLALFPEGGG